jgi:HlyD family secretion protein
MSGDSYLSFNVVLGCFDGKTVRKEYMPTPFSAQEDQKINSPERLNTLVEVTHRRAWITLCAICLIIVDALVWSIFGSLPLTIKGEGILLKNKVTNIDAQGSGVLTDVIVQPGFRVKVGDVIAKLRLPDLENKVAIMESKRALLIQERMQSIGQEDQERTRLGAGRRAWRHQQRIANRWLPDSRRPRLRS